jgi:hypothetical protein
VAPQHDRGVGQAQVVGNAALATAASNTHDPNPSARTESPRAVRGLELLKQDALGDDLN